MHEIADFFADLAAFGDESDYLSSSSDEDNARHKKQERHRRKSRLVPFYQTRKDVLTYFEDDRIFRTFHFDRESIQYITELVTPLLPKRKTKAKRNLEPLDMVLISLQYYATGTFQAAVGNILRYSQSSVSCSIAAVSLSLSLVSEQFIKFPQDLNQVLLSQSLKDTVRDTRSRSSSRIGSNSYLAPVSKTTSAPMSMSFDLCGGRGERDQLLLLPGGSCRTPLDPRYINPHSQSFGSLSGKDQKVRPCLRVPQSVDPPIQAPERYSPTDVRQDALEVFWYLESSEQLFKNGVMQRTKRRAIDTYVWSLSPRQWSARAVCAPEYHGTPAGNPFAQEITSKDLRRPS
ncbi:Uncharacterized protein APZ42_021953 [Daphnia magna]|uniref:Nuclease HARBI1 n=1 Tax=Daphnia magna TaxID=35525 RepID=A0A164W797_9CRUS|nr:Uncharacterized protein APZ42_021953 [Daphnia magna]